MMGYITDEPPEELNNINRSLQVTFISPQGNRMLVNVGADGKGRLIDTKEKHRRDTD